MSTYFKDNNADNHSSDSQGTLSKIHIYIQTLNDKVLYYKKERWVTAAVVFLIYTIRLLIIGGYYALSYCIGIHVLNSFIGFLSPLDDPEESEEGESYLPQK
jgi:hypothetical protein